MDPNTEPSGKYFLPDEVVIHNHESSAWVTVHGVVIDVTPLFQSSLKKPSMRKNLQWLLAFAGTDLSSFFDRNLAPLDRVNRNGERVPVFVPSMERNPATRLYWWHDPALVVGRITFHPCPVRIINTLTFHATEMTVCYEDTIAAVREKFLRFNDNAKQYEWRKDHAVVCVYFLSKLPDNSFLLNSVPFFNYVNYYNPQGREDGKLHMDKTLAENGFRVDREGSESVIWIFYILPQDAATGQPNLISDTESGSGEGGPLPNPQM